MVIIIGTLISALLGMLFPYLIDLFSNIVPTVFSMETELDKYFSSAFTVMRNVGLALIFLKFVKKGFETYVLYTDGDPDSEPVQLLVNYIKALAVALGFNEVYKLFAKALEALIKDIISSADILKTPDFMDFNPVAGIIVILSFIMFIVLYIKALGYGIQLIVLNIGVPLACVGLIDNDKGLFKNYFQVYVKLFLTLITQIALMQIGMIITYNSLKNVTTEFTHIFLGIGCMLCAFKVPNLLAEFLVPQASGGGAVSRAVYPTMQVINIAKSVAKR